MCLTAFVVAPDYALVATDTRITWATRDLIFIEACEYPGLKLVPLAPRSDGTPSGWAVGAGSDGKTWYRWLEQLQRTSGEDHSAALLVAESMRRTGEPGFEELIINVVGAASEGVWGAVWELGATDHARVVGMCEPGNTNRLLINTVPPADLSYADLLNDAFRTELQYAYPRGVEEQVRVIARYLSDVATKVASVSSILQIGLLHKRGDAIVPLRLLAPARSIAEATNAQITSAFRRISYRTVFHRLMNRMLYDHASVRRLKSPAGIRVHV